MVDKRRRKKARTQAHSSSEDESSASDHNDASVSELSELSEDESVQVASQPARPDEQHPRERLRKIPNAEEDFNQRYMKLVTEQFGEELAAMRQANDFGPASIAQLVAGLKQGVDIFSEEQRRLL